MTEPTNVTKHCLSILALAAENIEIDSYNMDPFLRESEIVIHTDVFVSEFEVTDVN